MIWRSLIVRNGGKITESLDLSLLSKVSDGFTGAQMNTAIQQILTERRIHQVGCLVACTCLCAYVRMLEIFSIYVCTFSDALQLHRKPLVTNELLGPLCKIDPIYKEEEEAFRVCVV